MPTPNKTRHFEIIAVLITAAGRFLFIDYLNWRLPYISIAIILWAGYVAYRSRTTTGILHHWGFRKDNFKKAIRLILPFGLLAISAFVAIGWYRGSLNITWHFIPVLLLYPLWGVVQQFLVITLMAGNLQDMQLPGLHRAGAILLSAILFGLIHYPSPWLMSGTFLLALFYGWVYLKERNIYALGIFHGWLGALFFYTVVGRDPFIEVFGRLFGLSN